MEDISLRINNFKCFGDDGQGYERILPINLIIGRNNSGKSTLLDIIAYLTSPTNLGHLAHKGKPPQVFLARSLSSRDLEFSLGRILLGREQSTAPGRYVRQWEGKVIVWEVKSNALEFVSMDPPFSSIAPPFGTELLPRLEKQLVERVGNPFGRYEFKRLLADRDVLAEGDAGSPGVLPNGDGTTRTIQHFINKAALPSALVEETLLRDLNTIFQPDGTFTRILVQQLDSGLWEIYLQESGKGSVPLSRSGSGVKTVLLVLAFVHLIPRLEDKPLSQYLFGFEELENNLHPALQRRLLVYLDNLATEKKCTFFLTTHSNVAIDLFANNDNAQIIHVTHNGDCAAVKTIATYGDSRGILDDLDIRASDLLQANGIVWVEGPSDRLYFNRWIELWSNGKIRENAHYQCVPYGGSLLAHLSVDDPEVNVDDLIEILRVNRNATLILDSDRKRGDDPLNATKNRIIEEMERMGGMAWVTNGRTIENYLSVEALSPLYDNGSLPVLRPYQDFPKYLDGIADSAGKKFHRNKVLFARQVLPHITIEQMENRLDLIAQVSEAGKRICAWNGFAPEECNRIA